MLLEQVMPQLILNVMDEKLGLIGHLVIHSTINGHSAGGIRMLPDVTIDEVTHLARNMTLKFGFWGIPIGGAKSCIVVSPTTPKRRIQILTAFGRSLSPLIKSKIYIPGIDMGISESDLQCVLTAAGFNTNLSKQEVGSDIYSSWTIFASAKAAASYIGLDLADSKVAIEGFGKVGSSTAQIFSEGGAKIVAISTIKGAVYDPAGLDVHKLIEFRRKFGDDMVKQYGTKKIEKSDLLCLPVDVLIPCARIWSINLFNVEKIKSKIICPGANVSMTIEVEKILHGRKILCIPDFIANSGGVFGSHVSYLVTDKKIKEIINDQFSKKVLEIIRLAERENSTPGEIAREIAVKRFSKTKLEAEQDVLEKNVFKSAFKLLPKSIRKTLAPIYFKRRLQL